MDGKDIAEMCGGYIRLHERFISSRDEMGARAKLSGTPDESRFYPSDQEVARCERLHRKIIERLHKGTQLQHWLNDQPAYLESLPILKKKDWYFWIHRYAPRATSMNVANEIEWQFIRLVASALLVYFDPYRFKFALANIGKLGVAKPSEKISVLASKLLCEMENSELIPSEALTRTLKRLADGEAPLIGRVKILETLSANRKRHLMIREIALLSPKTISPCRSKVGRFPPDLVLNILRLANIQSDLRTIQSIQKHYDSEKIKLLEDQDEYQPLTSGLRNKRRKQILEQIRKRREHQRLEQLKLRKHRALLKRLE